MWTAACRVLPLWRPELLHRELLHRELLHRELLHRELLHRELLHKSRCTPTLAAALRTPSNSCAPRPRVHNELTPRARLRIESVAARRCRVVQVDSPGPFELTRLTSSTSTSLPIHVTVHFHPSLNQSPLHVEHEVLLRPTSSRSSSRKRCVMT